MNKSGVFEKLASKEARSHSLTYLSPILFHWLLYPAMTSRDFHMYLTRPTPAKAPNWKGRFAKFVATTAKGASVRSAASSPLCIEV